MSALARWGYAFAFTQVVEVPIYRFGLGCGFWRAFGASSITHPIVWWLVSTSGWGSWAARTTAGELFAVVVEATWFTLPIRGARYGARRSATWSLAANATSFLLGLAAYAIFDP